MSNSSKFLKSRAVAVVIALFAIVASTLTIEPASAVVVGFGSQDKYFELGRPVDIDLNCQPSYGGEVVGNSSSALTLTLPDGLSVDPDWHLRGTPTKIQSIDTGAVRCFTGSDTPSNWVNWPLGIFHIVAASTPAPSITATSLNNPNCDLRIVGSLPATPDAGSVSLTLSNTFGAFSFTLKNYAASELIDITVGALDVTTLSQNANVVSAVPSPDSDANFCETAATATLSYQYAGAPAAHASAAVVVPTQLNTRPSVKVTALNDSACTIRIDANYPSVRSGERVTFYVATESFGYNFVFTGIHSGQLFSTEVSLFDVEGTASPDMETFGSWGDAPNCDSHWWLVNSVTTDAYGTQVGSTGQVMPHLPAAAGDPCEPGTYSMTGTVPCIDAEPGYYVDQLGAQSATPCNVGFFSSTAKSVVCAPAPLGTFVAVTGATSATACPTGMVTYLTASRSIHECYTLRAQTVKGIKILKTYKYAAKIYTQMTTDGGQSLTAVASGACTVARAKLTLKVKGKNTQVDRFLVTAGKKAGSCTVTFTQPGDDTYKPLTVVKTFKVSKTGK
jgi:hypothetical protein